MREAEWDERYKAQETPWDTGQPDENLVRYLRGHKPRGRALEIGCGTGTNAIWLSRQGFSVLGMDVSPAAIKLARAHSRRADYDCRFLTTNFLHDKLPQASFDFIFDRGCFHLFDKSRDRIRFAELVASLLKRHGRWMSLIGSKEGPKLQSGPPQHSAREVVRAIEPALEIIDLHSVRLRGTHPNPFPAWQCIARPRAPVRG